MLLKFLICRVDPKQKAEFSLGQASWGDLKNSRGFLGQIGGWDIKEIDKAHIVSVWKDDSSYEEFMNNQHDKIYTKRNQSDSILSIEVETYNIYLSFLDQLRNITEFLTDSPFIRIVKSKIKPSCTESYIEKQKNLWIPEMATTQKMDSCLFGESNRHKNSYITLTGWVSYKDHDWYQQNILPVLLEAADIISDIEQIEGWNFLVEEDWVVSP
ncbi:YdbC family protein [Terribacillus saccharophilus]|uniref:DUF4937 domain-containing protein n=1 Tax=Terribacillus saccharophilus TaxID=361277 RepID=A0ABX4GYI7_9BACI|nr:YdbC family protein [Terribacillus saccharophilus]PAD35773.1 hypothetical protein CHH56_07615 [Terribacillus saccharophilus]PAD96356.1 hypothetical protein CHH50_08940 [Terribacillus saccharophilus]PAD99931.1 hypothetical protein CHH48_09845 [Terribacillus saccharophilus]